MNLMPRADDAGFTVATRVSTTDWWKLAGVALLLVDHYGLFFDSDQDWWRVPGRLAAPIFFVLIGFGRTRQVPWRWIGLGLLLTGVDAWTSGDGLGRLNLNILINFAWIRLVRPFVEQHVLGRPGRVAMAALAAALLIRPLQPILEYGAEGWLWALLGAAHRFALDRPGDAPAARTRDALALAVPLIYGAKEVVDQAFGSPEAVVLGLLLAGLAVLLVRFRRASSPLRPPAVLVPAIRFVGQRSLEIYAVTLLAMQILAYAIGEDLSDED